MELKEFGSIIFGMGGDAYQVGGSVRDQFLGVQPKDLDLVVCGIEESMFVERFPDAVKVGQSFPVYLVDIGGEQVEVAFARSEKKVGKGYCGFEVAYDSSISIEQDLYRRDLTVCAIAKHVLSEDVYCDPYGGIADIKEKVLKPVSVKTFKEDPIRALRAARFHASLEFKLSEELKQLMKACKDELKDVPKERIILEMRKAFKADKPSKFFQALKDADLLDVCFPILHAMIGVEQSPVWHPEGDVFEHAMQAIDIARSVSSSDVLLYAALMHDAGKIMTKKELYPKHHGHDLEGVKVLSDHFKKLGSAIPKDFKQYALIVSKEHMRVRELHKESKIIECMHAIAKVMSFKEFSIVVLSDSGKDAALGIEGIVPWWIVKGDEIYKELSIISRAVRKELYKQGVEIKLIDHQVLQAQIKYLKSIK